MAAETCHYCSGIVARTDKTCPHCQRSLTATAAENDGVPATMPSSAILLLLPALILGVLGVAMLSEATRGVGLICFGCLLMVWARMLQAGAHHRQAVQRRRG